MPVPTQMEFFVDPGRCIGCQSCVQACSECDTHKGHSMIQLDYIDRASSTQTVPVICMHCDSPTCAEVCPADAIKRTGDGVVQSARKPRCIACNNCVIACPFGVPKMNTGTREEIEKLRPLSRPINQFQFGNQTISTRVNLMVPKAAPAEHLDVTAVLHEAPVGQDILDGLLMDNMTADGGEG